MVGLVENKRILLLATLLASALITAALITIMTPTAAAATSRRIKVMVISRDGVIELYQDGKLIETIKIKTIKAPEGAKHLEVFSGEDGSIYFKFEVEAPPCPGKELEEKAVEIVRNSPRIQEVIGSGYEIIAVATSSRGEPAIVMVKASDETCYRLTVNLDQGVVESIEKAETCTIQLTSRAG